MDVSDYRCIIQDLLQSYLMHESKDDPIATQLVCDTERDHYQLIYIGWRDEEQIYGCPVHIDIIDNKIWVQRDFTESGVAQQLVERGIPRMAIVLGYRSPFVRQFSGYAVA